MELPVILALTVLAFVFIFSLSVLILLCRHHRRYLKAFKSQIRLQYYDGNEKNFDSLTQISPLIENVLDCNQWLCGMEGILHNCVNIMKLGHLILQHLAKSTPSAINSQVNQSIVTVARRIIPVFDELVKTMAEDPIDPRVLEARFSALYSLLWAITFAYSLISPKITELPFALLKKIEVNLGVLNMIANDSETYFENASEKDVDDEHLSNTIIEDLPLPDNVEVASCEEAPADPVTRT